MHIKKIHQLPLALALAMMPALTSCSKWLDVKPKTEIKEEDLLSTETGFQNALYGVYTLMGDASVYGDQLTLSFVDVIAQRYNVTSTQNPFYTIQRYNYTSDANKIRIANIWRQGFKVIANTNNILEQIDNKQDLFASKNYELIKGECLGVRAFVHFDLLRLFGPIPLADDNRPCIPYVTKLGKTSPPRMTRQEVLNNILKDLDEAEKLLSVYPYIDPYSEAYRASNTFLAYRQNRMNYWAAKALKARVYMYKGEKANALRYALEVINSMKFPFVKVSALTNLGTRDRTFVTEHVFGLHIRNLKDNVDDHFRYNSNNDLNVSTTTRDNIFEVAGGGSTDFRYAYLWENASGKPANSKYWQDWSNNFSGPRLTEVMAMIRISEMYYIAAECTADLATATGYINLVRENRGLKPVAVTTDQQLQTEIRKEFQKEFWGEGQLFHYYKRKNTKFISGTTREMDASTYVLPLPDNEIQFGN